MKIIFTSLLTLLGFCWGFLSTGAFFIAGLAGPAGGSMNLLLSLTLFLPGFLGFLTYDLLNKLFHVEASVLALLFSIIYGIIMLLLIKEIFQRFRRNKNLAT